MSEQNPSMARRIQQGVDQHREYLLQKQGMQEQRDQEQAECLEFGESNGAPICSDSA